jgi:hypothetical protein
LEKPRKTSGNQEFGDTKLNRILTASSDPVQGTRATVAPCPDDGTGACASVVHNVQKTDKDKDPEQ